MALPAGVTTCEVRFGSPASGFTGEAVSASISVQPTTTLIWAATGQPVIDFVIAREAAEGIPGVVSLPHVDQAGFRDQAGNDLTLWAYVISGSWKSGSQSKPFRRVVQPYVGQVSIDLDLVPEGVAVPAVVAPTLPVTSLAGLTGAVTAGQVQAILDAGVPADATWDSVTSKPLTFPPSAHTHTIVQVDGLQAALDAAGSGGGGGLTTEQVQDLIAAMLVEGANVDLTYDDTAGTLTITASGGEGEVSWSTLADMPAVIAAGETAAEARAAIGAAALADAPVPVLSIDTAGAPILDKETWVPTTYKLDGQTIPGDIRGRGNSTWAQPKKPWNMRLTNTTSLLGMTAAKRWSLLANYIDMSQIRNAVVMEIGARMTGLEWTPKCRHVEVVLNGVPQGLYQLFEPVRMEAGRVPGSAASGSTGLTVTGTYLLEIDNYAPTEPGTNWFPTTHDGLPIKLDDPDGANATSGAGQIAYITDWVNNFETVLYGPDWLDPDIGYAKLIDRDSFIDWYLVNELVAGNDSGFATSCKLYKTRDAVNAPGKLFLGPLWDYDLSLGVFGYSATGWWVRGTTTPIGGSAAPGATWINRMVADPDFFAALLTRWGQMMTLIADVPAFIDTTARRIAIARSHDSVIWDGSQDGRVAGGWRGDVEAMKVWLAARIAWIDTNLPGSSGGADVTAPTTPTGLAASAVTATGFTVSWDASTDDVAVTGYQVRLDGGTAVDKTGLSHGFTGLTAETEYAVDVRARDEAGNWSDWSTPLPVETGEPGSSLPAVAAAWGFAETSGTTAADSSGNGHTLTVTAPMLGNPGHTGTGLRQVAGTPVRIASDWITGTDCTIMFWARKTGTNQGFARGVVLEDDSANTRFGVFVETFVPDIRFQASTNIDNYLVTAAVTPINEWHHYCLTMQAGTLRSYLDGVQVGSDVPVAGALLAHTKLALCNAEMIGMDLDDVRVLNVGVTAGEVNEFMATPV